MEQVSNRATTEEQSGSTEGYEGEIYIGIALFIVFAIVYLLIT